MKSITVSRLHFLQSERASRVDERLSVKGEFVVAERSGDPCSLDSARALARLSSFGKGIGQA